MKHLDPSVKFLLPSGCVDPIVNRNLDMAEVLLDAFLSKPFHSSDFVHSVKVLAEGEGFHNRGLLDLSGRRFTGRGG